MPILNLIFGFTLIFSAPLLAVEPPECRELFPSGYEELGVPPKVIESLSLRMPGAKEALHSIDSLIRYLSQQPPTFFEALGLVAAVPETRSFEDLVPDVSLGDYTLREYFREHAQKVDFKRYCDGLAQTAMLSLMSLNKDRLAAQPISDNYRWVAYLARILAKLPAPTPMNRDIRKIQNLDAKLAAALEAYADKPTILELAKALPNFRREFIQHRLNRWKELMDASTVGLYGLHTLQLLSETADTWNSEHETFFSMISQAGPPGSEPYTRDLISYLRSYLSVLPALADLSDSEALVEFDRGLIMGEEVFDWRARIFIEKMVFSLLKDGIYSGGEMRDMLIDYFQNDAFNVMRLYRQGLH